MNIPVKKALCLLLFLPCLLLMTAAAPPPAPPEGAYLADLASALSDNHREAVAAISQDLYERTGVELAVLIIPSLEGEEMGQYGARAFREWGLGGPDHADGALLVVSVGDKSSRLFAGSGLEELAAYKNTQVASYGRKRSRAILDVYRPLAGHIYSLRGAAPGEEAQQLLDGGKKNSGPFPPVVVVFLLVMILAMGRSVRVSRKYRKKYLKGHVRKPRAYTRSRDEEEQYKDADIYQIKHDDMD